jgi:hypothetical protein
VRAFGKIAALFEPFGSAGFYNFKRVYPPDFVGF